MVEHVMIIKERIFPFINEIMLEKGTRFQDETAMHTLFYYIEKFYQIYKTKRLLGIDHVATIDKCLSKHEKIITIETPYFICKLASTKFVYSKRTKINALRLGINRKADQLTLNRANFNRYKTLTNANIMTSKPKFISLFPPNYMHSMDAIMPHMSIHKFMDMSNKLKLFNSRVNVETIHVNFTTGHKLYPTLPEILIYRLLFLLIKAVNCNVYPRLRDGINFLQLFVITLHKSINETTQNLEIYSDKRIYIINRNTT